MRKSRKTKKSTCFEWIPTNLPNPARGLPNFLNGFLGFLVSQIPLVSADTFFESISPSNPNAVRENILACCNGQEEELIQNLTQVCRIFNIRHSIDWRGFALRYASYGSIPDNKPACVLFYNERAPEINACIDGLLRAEVKNGLINTCAIESAATSKTIGIIFGTMFALILLGVIITPFIVWLRSRRNNNLPIPINNDAQALLPGDIVENSVPLALIYTPNPESNEGRFSLMLKKLNEIEIPAQGSDEFINEFKKKFTNLKLAFEEFKNKYQCGISLEIIDNPVSLDCLHVFELELIEKSVKQNKCCPNCRAVIDYPIRLNNSMKGTIQDYLKRLSTNLNELEEKLAMENSPSLSLG